MIRLYKQQLGLTLIELMVTLAISGVILAGVVNIYSNSLMQSKLTGNLSSMQESGRFALEMLSRDIRMAGYTGCLNYDAAAKNADDPVYMLYKRGADNNAIFGLAGREWSGSAYGGTGLAPMVTPSTAPIGTNGGSWISSGGAALATNYPEAIANSDVIQVWTTAEVAIDASGFSATASQVEVTVDSGHGFKKGDVIMFANCGMIMVAQICSTSDTKLTIVPGGSSTCGNDFNIGKDVSSLQPADANVSTFLQGLETYSFRDATYFVGKRDTGTSTPPSLYRGVNGTSREMVEGVENMQILYGVDLNHVEGEPRTPSKYVTAAQVGDLWSDVVAVRVSVLMRSFEKGLGGTTYTFNFNGKSYTATDGYLRQAYSTTIALRNRNVGEVTGLFTTTTTP